MKLLGFTGHSGSGKTTLIERIIPAMLRRGIRVAAIKHAHHDCDIDRLGKDSYRFRAAGAAEVILASDRRWAMMHELNGAPEPSVVELAAKFAPCDLVIVEGFKREPIPRIEVHRRGAKEGFLYPNDKHIIALATDQAVAVNIPQLDVNNIPQVIEFIMHNVLKPRVAPAPLEAAKQQ